MFQIIRFPVAEPNQETKKHTHGPWISHAHNFSLPATDARSTQVIQANLIAWLDSVRVTSRRASRSASRGTLQGRCSARIARERRQAQTAVEAVVADQRVQLAWLDSARAISRTALRSASISSREGNCFARTPIERQQEQTAAETAAAEGTALAWTFQSAPTHGADLVAQATA